MIFGFYLGWVEFAVLGLFFMGGFCFLGCKGFFLVIIIYCLGFGLESGFFFVGSVGFRGRSGVIGREVVSGFRFMIFG